MTQDRERDGLQQPHCKITMCILTTVGNSETRVADLLSALRIGAGPFVSRD